MDTNARQTMIKGMIWRYPNGLHMHTSTTIISGFPSVRRSGMNGGIFEVSCTMSRNNIHEMKYTDFYNISEIWNFSNPLGTKGSNPETKSMGQTFKLSNTLWIGRHPRDSEARHSAPSAALLLLPPWGPLSQLVWLASCCFTDCY